MSLRIALNAATSSLLATQSQMALTSANIANADTEGYTRKTASSVATVSGGQVTGVTLSSVESTVSKALLKDLASALSTQGKTTAVADLYNQLGNLMGAVEDDGSGTSLTTLLSDLEDALDSLADTPESSTLASSTVAALADLAVGLRSTSSDIQGLRLDADSGIADAVDTVNNALEAIDSLNDQIQAAVARGQSTADLEDQRNTALEAIAEQMNVTWFVDDQGAMKIYTSSGTALLDSQVHSLSFDASGAMNSSVTYPGVLSGITVGSTDITSQITGGTIAGLLEMRDETLPAVQDELDTLANGLIDTLNAVHNAGTASPAPNTLTGTTSVSSSDTLGAAGTFRVALVDDDGTVQEYADFDLSSYVTISDLISDIDSLSGVSASLDSDGHLVVGADDDSLGIALNEMDSDISGQGASGYFGLNDLLTGDGAETIAVSPVISRDTSLLATATLSSDSTLSVGDDALDDGDSSTVSALAEVLRDSWVFAASGNLGTSETTFSSYMTDIISDVSLGLTAAESAQVSAETAYSTLSDVFASQTGVNLDEETARLEELQNAYDTAAMLIKAINEMFDSLINMMG